MFLRFYVDSLFPFKSFVAPALAGSWGFPRRDRLPRRSANATASRAPPPFHLPCPSFERSKAEEKGVRGARHSFPSHAFCARNPSSISDFGRLTLLLEQILERLPRIERPCGRRSFGGYLGGLHVRSGSRILLNRRSELVKCAVVLRVLRRNPRWYRLCALELSPAIEIAALLTTMQFEIAFRTLPVGIEASHQYCAAVRASRPSHGADHPRRARAKVIRGAPWSALRWLAVSVLLLVFFLLFGLTIAAVTVLAIHKRLRPSVATDCNCTLLHDWVKTCLFPRCIQSERFKRPANQSSPLKLFWNAV